jgi:hypothetical protein
LRKVRREHGKNSRFRLNEASGDITTWEPKDDVAICYVCGVVPPGTQKLQMTNSKTRKLFRDQLAGQI